jgi:hypothetical protein
MTKLLLSLFFLVACSMAETLEKRVEKAGPLVMKSIPVKSRSEANKYIQNQRNYLILLFEQSRDPYYGVPKWKDECLKANRIGDIIETQSAIVLSSRLYLDPKGNPGFCFGDPAIVYGQQIIVYCEGDNVVKDMSFKTTKGLDHTKYKICD